MVLPERKGSPFSKRIEVGTPIKNKHVKIPSTFQLETKSNGDCFPHVYDTVGRVGLREKVKG